MAAALVISAAAAAVLVISDKKETARPVTEKQLWGGRYEPDSSDED